jgi:hypothetical protein
VTFAVALTGAMLLWTVLRAVAARRTGTLRDWSSAGVGLAVSAAIVAGGLVAPAVGRPATVDTVTAGMVQGNVPNVGEMSVAGERFQVLQNHAEGVHELAEGVRYAGSPLAYSFSEARHRKSVWLVDLDERGLGKVRRHELPIPRPLAEVSGTLDELLSDPAHDRVADHYLSVTLTDAVRPIDAMRKLRERFGHAVRLEWQPPGGACPQLRYTAAARGRSDREIADAFLDACRGAPASDSEAALLDEALQAADMTQALGRPPDADVDLGR